MSGVSGRVGIEVCCGDPASVLAAKAGGADRIELCTGLSEGGLTPSIGLVRAAVASGIKDVNVLVRPRPGDFLYTEEELGVMADDIKAVIAAGATGVVIGVLTADGDVDIHAMQGLLGAVDEGALMAGRKVSVTFHRAFDVASDPFKALEDVISLGCDTILTSGAASTAEKGIGIIKGLVDRAAGRIAIMAGAGVRLSNVRKIVEGTGVRLVHSTARDSRPSAMRFRREEVSMGVPGYDEYSLSVTSSDVVSDFVEILDRL